MTKDIEERFPNHDFYHEPLDDWPLTKNAEKHNQFLLYLENLRKKRKINFIR